MNQPKILALKHYKLEEFSVERLTHFATALEHDVVIEIRRRAKTEKREDFSYWGALAGAPYSLAAHAANRFVQLLGGR